MRLKSSIIAACFAAFFVAGTAPIDHMPPQVAKHIAELKDRAAKLRQRWMAAHPGEDPDAGAVQPSITAGTVLSTSINVQVAPAQPTLSYTFKTGVSGLYFAYFEFVGPSGEQSLFVEDENGSASTGGTHILRGDEYSNLYAAPGTYTLTYAEIDDYAGHYTYYDSATQLASIFTKTSFTVINNGQADTTIPTIVSGKILTSSVSLSAVRPYFETQLAVSDTISGVSYGYIILTDPNGDEYYAYGFTSAPILKTANMTVLLDYGRYSNVATGTWTITGAYLQDVASNYYYVTSAAELQSLFGTTTFTVTK